MSIDAKDSDIMRELVAEATADGIKRAVADPALWAAASEGMRRHASAEAGGWLLSGLRIAFSRVAWLAVISLGIYLVGGWSALVAFIKASGGGAQ